jgi:hypothetical protein
VFEAIQKIHTKTNKNEEFLSISDNENGIIVFSTFRNLHFLCSSDTIYMDGNFQFCTKFFCQMFTIQAFRNGYYIPVVFCLLPDKRTVTEYFVYYLTRELSLTRSYLKNHLGGLSSATLFHTLQMPISQHNTNCIFCPYCLNKERSN